jgi:SAM-dependent methyltransferase
LRSTARSATPEAPTVTDAAAPGFRADLYKGTAAYYDRFRRPYPEALFADLRLRVPITGTGRLLDLACGTGQVAVPLAAWFTETVALDAEPETVAFASQKAARHGPSSVKWLAGTAEEAAVDGQFELIAVGTAFHRLDRRAVARRMRQLVADSGAVALLWSPVPSDGDEPWQRELRQVIVDWLDRAGSGERIPPGWEASRAASPDREVLERAGFAYEGRFEFGREDVWTVESLIGFLHSTSILSRPALGGAVEAFETDVARRLGPFSSDGTFRHQTSCAYELARPDRGDE